MRVLVACEYSGIVRDAFTAKGHYSVSCDLLPTESEGLHYKGDVLDILYDNWDLMIAHPPCTYLSNAGSGWFNEDKYGDKARERKNKRLEAMDFVTTLWGSGIPKICIENPVGYLNSHWRKPNQSIHPYMFGDAEMKRTCLWLKNLSVLHPTNIVAPVVYGICQSGKRQGRKYYRTEHLSDAKERSRFFIGIAAAMASQWG